jgi:hypothetical protein
MLDHRSITAWAFRRRDERRPARALDGREPLLLECRDLRRERRAPRARGRNDAEPSRGRVMEKTGADSVADLVRMVERLGVQPAAVPLAD